MFLITPNFFLNGILHPNPRLMYVFPVSVWVSQVRQIKLFVLITFPPIGIKSWQGIHSCIDHSGNNGCQCFSAWKEYHKKFYSVKLKLMTISELYHLSTTTSFKGHISGIYSLNDTSEQRPLVHNTHYFGIPMVFAGLTVNFN